MQKNIRRIGFLIDSIHHLSGVSVTVTDWVNWLNENNYPAEIIYCDREKYTKCSGLNLRSSFRLRSVFGSGVYADIPNFVDIAKKLHKRHYDVLHVSTPGPMGLLGLFYSKMYGIPLVGTYHTHFPDYIKIMGYNRFSSFSEDYLSWMYKSMNLVACPSTDTQNRLLRHGFNDNDLRVIHRGLDMEKFNPSFASEEWLESHGIRPHALKLLYVGRIVKEKGLDSFALTLRDVMAVRKDIDVIFVGEGSFESELKILLPSAHFLGRLQGEDLSRVYASSDVFLFPSKTDTFGRVVLEALSSGLPVICSDVGGHLDMVRHGENGFSGNIDNFDFMMLALREIEVNDCIGGICRESVSHYDFDSVNSKMLDFLMEGICLKKR